MPVSHIFACEHCKHVFSEDAKFYLHKEYIPREKSKCSSPPRNCDVGTAEEQAQRYDKFCEGTDCVKCPVHSLWHHYFEICKNGRVSCGLIWAQMPYEEKERKEDAND